MRETEVGVRYHLALSINMSQWSLTPAAYLPWYEGRGGINVKARWELWLPRQFPMNSTFSAGESIRFDERKSPRPIRSRLTYSFTTLFPLLLLLTFFFLFPFYSISFLPFFVHVHYMLFRLLQYILVYIHHLNVYHIHKLLLCQPLNDLIVRK